MSDENQNYPSGWPSAIGIIGVAWAVAWCIVKCWNHG